MPFARAFALDLTTGKATPPETGVASLHITPAEGPDLEQQVSAPQVPETFGVRTEVITHQDLVARGVTTASQALELISGISTDQPSQGGGVSSLYLRGGDPNFTLILIDGAQINDPTNSRGGSVDLTTLGIENIERIEITKGPLSLLYGSGALSGVIQLITRKGSRPGEVSGEESIGDFGHYYFKAETDGADAIHNYSSGLSALDSGRNDDQSDSRLQSFSSRFDTRLAEQAAITWTMRLGHSTGESFPDDSGGEEFADIRQLEDRENRELLSSMQIHYGDGDRYSAVALVALSKSENEVNSPGVAPGIRDPFGIPPVSSDDNYQRLELSHRSEWKIDESFTLFGGAAFNRESGRSNSEVDFGGELVPLNFDESRQTPGIFGGTQYELIPGLVASAGLRYDIPDSSDTQTSPQVGVSYRHPELLTELRANWARGFKLPSFYALGNPIVGNPDLKAETAQGGELGIAQPFFGDRFKTSLTGFLNEYHNAIDLAEGPPPQLVNRDIIRTQGFELEAQIKPLPYLSLTAQTTYVDFEIPKVDEQLRNRPHWRGGAQCTLLPSEKLSLNVSWAYTGEVLDSSIPNGDEMLGGWATLNAAANYHSSQYSELFITVLNILDEDYKTIIGNPAPGISPRVGVRVRF